MWTREQLKNNAKEVLRNSYWWAFLICFVFTIIAGVGSGSSNVSSRLSKISNDTGRVTQHIIDVDDLENADNLSRQEKEQLQEYIDSIFNPTSIALGFAGLLISLVISIFKAAYNIFVTNPLTVGYNYYFMQQREGSIDFKNLFSGFMGGKYMSRVKVMFFHSLYIFLWSLLFVVPGIIKSYSYYMVPYILADNPDISKDRAFEISMKTMDGEKFDLFVLQLSFIGWQLLGLLCCCVGIYFVNPYVQATMCEFYLVMRQKAITSGIASPSDFNLPANI
ncbi:Protein of unknown function [Ruminococcaceae bacterium YRB3002]|nr:Protein of unknown function [Ruminococcaceae bacterium YRB3002]